MASTSNAENLVEIARIVYQLCDYTDFRADYLKLEFAGSGWFSQIRSHIKVLVCVCGGGGGGGGSGVCGCVTKECVGWDIWYHLMFAQ